MILATAANPKNFGSWKEKAYIVTSYVIFCASTFTYGLGMSRVEDDAAVKEGKGRMTMAVFCLVILPAYLVGLTLYSKFPDAKLSSAMLSFFQSAPSILGSLLYVSSSSFRCILNSDEELSWKSVMDLRMSTMQFIQGFLFSTWTLLTLVIFANTNDNGAEYDDFLQLLVTAKGLVYVVFFTLIIWDVIMKQFLCKRTTATTTDDTRESDNSGAFGLHEVGLSNSGML
ncbi:hypothetical protein TrST_g10011 [Triparma strigata]|uniref:Uncharacterized protein n=3 Tax=Triparma strigata TaxID=1606541 RepID=A0A9W7BNY0_9STRA|nr:hypothetical protein TrST_g10011 [Triparma strigata]